MAEEAGFDRGQFDGRLPRARTPATRPSAISSPPRSSASSGFPTLIAGSEEKGYALVTNGYRPLDDLLEPLERWWAAGAPVTKAELEPPRLPSAPSGRYEASCIREKQRRGALLRHIARQLELGRHRPGRSELARTDRRRLRMRTPSTGPGQAAKAAINRRSSRAARPSLAAFALAASLVAQDAPAGAMEVPRGELRVAPLQHPHRHGAPDLDRADHGADGQPDQRRLRQPQAAGDARRAAHRLLRRVGGGRRARDRGAAPDQGHPRARDRGRAGRRMRLHVRVHLRPGPEALSARSPAAGCSTRSRTWTPSPSRRPSSTVPPGSAWSTRTSSRPACPTPGSPT